MRLRVLTSSVACYPSGEPAVPGQRHPEGPGVYRGPCRAPWVLETCPTDSIGQHGAVASLAW